MFKDLKNSLDENRKSFSSNVKEIVEQSKVVVFITMCSTCLIVGYAMGCTTTSAMYKTLGKNKK